MGLFTGIERSTEFASGGIQKLIPEGTVLLCNIASVSIEPATQYNNEHIKIALHVVEKGEYKDFVVNHKIQVNDDNAEKREKALKLLLTYDTNCKGALAKADDEGKDILDGLVLSRALNGGSVMATFDTWSMDGSDGVTRTGNWVRKISPAPKSVRAQDAAIEKAAQSAEAAPVAQSTAELSGRDDQDIPF
jgi:hypothetical protein